MSVVHVGATKKFADNWENIFGGKRKASGSKATGKTAKKSAKKVTSKLAGKKRSAKKKARLRG